MTIDDAVAPSAAWEDFPVLELDPAFRPFDSGVMGSSATAICNYLTAKRLLGSASEVGLKDRLHEVGRLAAEGVRAARAEGASAEYMCRPVTPEDQPGFAFFLLVRPEESESFPLYQLYAALALWLLWESQQAMCADWYRGVMLAEQAGFCLQMATGEGGNIVGSRAALEFERKRRASSCRIGPAKRFKKNNDKWGQVYEDYDSGAWKSMASAVRLLAAKHNVEVETLRKRLLKRKSELVKQAAAM